MSNSNQVVASSSSSSVGLGSLLAVAFIVLKLTHVIHWPWLWVVAPIWIPAAIVVLVLLVGALVVACSK